MQQRPKDGYGSDRVYTYATYLQHADTRSEEMRVQEVIDV
jgi:hypothetical protein